MDTSIHDLLRALVDIQLTLHAAGTISVDALAAIAKHASTRKIINSAETGCGATTLLLSHLSQKHVVFSLDAGASIANVRRSPLRRSEAVTFVEGPITANPSGISLSRKAATGPHRRPSRLSVSRPRVLLPLPPLGSGCAVDPRRYSDSEHSQSLRVPTARFDV
jgi:hypothetical protein